MTWTQLHYLTELTYLTFLDNFSSVVRRDKKDEKQNLQVLYFSAFLSIAIMHRNSMPVSVFQTSFDVIRKLNLRYPEVLAVQCGQNQ